MRQLVHPPLKLRDRETYPSLMQTSRGHARGSWGGGGVRSAAYMEDVIERGRHLDVFITSCLFGQAGK